jgi:hypothetical protein
MTAGCPQNIGWLTTVLPLSEAIINHINPNSCQQNQSSFKSSIGNCQAPSQLNPLLDPLSAYLAAAQYVMV